MANYQFVASSPTTEIHFSEKLPKLLFSSSNKVTVFDRNTARILGSGVPDPIVIDDRDGAKNWTSVEKILLAALNRNLDRSGEIIAVGGGMVCDTAAFAASIYMRGIKLTLFPTTVTAMVDAAFGGKTGINLLQSKNQIGTFYPAQSIIIVPKVLSKLSENDYLDGLSEVIKTAMLGDAELLNILEQYRTQILAREPNMVKEFVRRCLAVKARFVVKDLREEHAIDLQNTGDSRMFLNLGHTFAHALESASNFSWTHGAAVAWGIGRALSLGRLLKITNPIYVERIHKILDDYGYQLNAPEITAESLLKAMQSDKKRRGDKLLFVLQRDILQTVLLSVESQLVRQSLIK